MRATDRLIVSLAKSKSHPVQCLSSGMHYGRGDYVIGYSEVLFWWSGLNLISTPQIQYSSRLNIPTWLLAIPVCFLSLILSKLPSQCNNFLLMQSEWALVSWWPILQYNIEIKLMWSWLYRHLRMDSGHLAGLVDRENLEIVFTVECAWWIAQIWNKFCPKPQKCVKFQCLQTSVGMQHV